MNLTKEELQLLIQALENVPTGNLKSAKALIALQEKLKEILNSKNE